MSCFIDSLFHHIFKLFMHANVEKNRTIYITKPPILAIHEAISDINDKSTIVAIITIAKIIKLKCQTLTYHKINSFSASDKKLLNFILFFINGAKNIIPAIAESFA